MLYFIGLGLDQSPSLKTMNILERCDKVYYESYTSPIVSDAPKELTSSFSNVQIVKREFVEDGRAILESAKNSNAALVCPGDPMVATTHQELRTRAMREGIATSIIHGSSVVSAVSGELGLHVYNFGRIVTVTKEPMQYTAYNTIFRNLLQGLHSTVLLEWDESTNFFLKPAQAISGLLDAERDLRYGLFGEHTFLLVASRIGTEKVGLKASTFGNIRDSDIGAPPHVIVIPGRLHFTEREALGAIFGAGPESFRDNSEGVTKLSRAMVTKYSEKTLKALGRAKTASGNGAKFSDVFENVECYTSDALRFLNEGKDELAVLSVGYAEGLLDSLRFSGQLEFEW